MKYIKIFVILVQLIWIGIEYIQGDLIGVVTTGFCYIGAMLFYIFLKLDAEE